MKLRQASFALALAAAACSFTFAPRIQAETAHEGEDLKVTNKTGHDVIVFLLQDDKVHLSETGGTQVAKIKNGDSAIAHVPNCKFSIILVDKDDVWHAEFHDCHSTEMTFTMETGHAKRDPKK